MSRLKLLCNTSLFSRQFELPKSRLEAHGDILDV